MSNPSIPLPWVTAGATRGCAAWAVGSLGRKVTFFFPLVLQNGAAGLLMFPGQGWSNPWEPPVLELVFFIIFLQVNPETFPLEEVQSSHSLHPDVTLGGLWQTAGSWIAVAFWSWLKTSSFKAVRAEKHLWSYIHIGIIFLLNMWS